MIAIFYLSLVTLYFFRVNWEHFQQERPALERALAARAAGAHTDAPANPVYTAVETAHQFWHAWGNDIVAAVLIAVAAFAWIWRSLEPPDCLAATHYVDPARPAGRRGPLRGGRGRDSHRYLALRASPARHIDLLPQPSACSRR